MRITASLPTQLNGVSGRTRSNTCRLLAGVLDFCPLEGEAREHFEVYENELFSTKPAADNASLLQRYLRHADYHPTEWLRAFGQLQSSLVADIDSRRDPSVGRVGAVAQSPRLSCTQKAARDRVLNKVAL
jgi:hypothetical protein